MPLGTKTPLPATAGLAWLCLLLIGCQPAPTNSPRPARLGSDDITEIHLITAAAAISSDGQGRVAGFPVRIYASSPRTTETVPIAKGTLEIQMFDGSVSRATLATTPPLRTWSFTADQLRSRAKRSPVGASYSMTLFWDDKQPTQDRITIVACYRHPRGISIYSALTTLFVQDR